MAGDNRINHIWMQYVSFHVTKYRSVKISAVSVLSTGNMARTEFFAFQVVYLLRVTDYEGAAYRIE